MSQHGKHVSSDAEVVEQRLKRNKLAPVAPVRKWT